MKSILCRLVWPICVFMSIPNKKLEFTAVLYVMQKHTFLTEKLRHYLSACEGKFLSSMLDCTLSQELIFSSGNNKVITWVTFIPF